MLEIRLHVNPSKTIAVVDDDAAVRSAISGLMRSLGWDVRQFASGVEFLRSGSAANTACLITDVRMPQLTGVELHDRLLAQGHKVPTIFITAFPTPELKERLNTDGVMAIFEKPVDPDAMVDCVDQLFRGH